MIDPCIDFCYTRFGKQYSNDCMKNCKYAKMARDERVKILIESSTSFEKADAYLTKYTDFNSDEERIKYLSKMFNCWVLKRNHKEDHDDYIALLTTIVNKKWK